MIIEYINNHPFPNNGKDLNIQLAAEYPTATESRKVQIREKLFELNCRLCFVAHRQFSYGYEVEEIAGQLHLTIMRCLEIYDPSKGLPFYHYVLQRLRGDLQYLRGKESGPVEVPVRQQRKEEYQYNYHYTDSEDFYTIEDESQSATDASSELTDIISDMERRFPKYAVHFYILRKVAEGKTQKEIGRMFGRSEEFIYRRKKEIMMLLKEYAHEYV
jgi:RNA polymerase sigma factor (sigma-70 family)